MRRLAAYTVSWGLVIACRLAICPTSFLPLLASATTDGVSVCPARLLITTGWLPWTAATTLLVVPRSMPMTGSRSAIVRSSHAIGRCSERPTQLSQPCLRLFVRGVHLQRLHERLLRQLLRPRLVQDRAQQRPVRGALRL